MTTIKNFCTLTLFFAIAMLFNTQTASAQAGDANGDVVVDLSDYTPWNAYRGTTQVNNGTLLLATHKTDRSQLVAEMRDGKIAKIVVKKTTGNIVLRPSTESPCTSIQCAANQLRHCFQLPGGGCVCICGSWITMYPGN